jgi:hypothetical protein
VDTTTKKFLERKNENTASVKKSDRANILRDSLEDPIDPPVHTGPLEKETGKASVQNEEGETLEVLYDPILKCYYDPRTNTYYELN